MTDHYSSRPDRALAAACALALLCALPGRAQAQTPAGPSVSPSAAPADAASKDGDIWSRATLLGDAGGLRTSLGNVGLSFGLQDTDELLGNTSGGTARGIGYDGLTMLSVGLDTQKAGGWEGGLFNASLLNIRGTGITNNLQSLQTPSGIIAAPTTRLWEAWFQQSFADGTADVKVGQQSLDLEFMTSTNSGVFINTMMGWPMVPSADLYGGGPAYPTGSLGVRFRAQPNDAVTVLAGVFDDDPAAGRFYNDSQLRGAERTGTRFNLGNGALLIAELQYAINQPPATPASGDPTPAPAGLAGTYKLGAWFDTGSFPSPSTDANGLSLANPASNGNPRMLRQNFSLYGVVDQVIWQPDLSAAQALSVFARALGASGDRNLIDFSINGGITLKAPFAGRDNDVAGLGFGVARLSSAVGQFDQAYGYYNRIAYPVRSTETFIEATYDYAAAPWWSVQPDFQYVFNPGGGIPNPANPAQRIGNEAIFGVRNVITF